MSTSWEPRKSVFRAVPRAVMGPLFRHNESVRDQTSCKVNVGKNEVHLTSIYSPSAPENCFCFAPSTWYLFANHKELHRSRSVCPPCLCNVSAAVVAKIVLKSNGAHVPAQQLSRKSEEGHAEWKEISSWLSLFKLQEWQNMVEWQGGPGG